MVELGTVTTARFWSKVRVEKSVNACWEWQGSFTGNGYGNFKVPALGNQSVGAHRVAYALHNGAFPPDGLLIRHTCDNPKCVNPNHLLVGDKKDNANDAKERGRLKPRSAKGDLNPARKLSSQDVARIKQLILAGKDNSALGEQFGVTHSAISAIRRGKVWVDVMPLAEPPVGAL